MNQLGFNKYYRIPFVQKLSKKTKQPPFLIVFAFLLLFVIFLLTPFGCVLTTALAFGVPAFHTFKALESEDTKDDKRLLTFWIVFGLFYFFDDAIKTLFFFVPGFSVMRLGVIFYLYHPKTNGAENIYQKVIHPLFTNYQDKIEKIINPLEKKTEQITQKIKKLQ